MRFSLCASGLVLATCWLATPIAMRAQKLARHVPNELTIAGLRPGRDSLKQAVVLYKKESYVFEEDSIHEWDDVCRDEILQVEVNKSGQISLVRVRNGKRIMADCFRKMSRTKWRTGHDIAAFDSAQRVIEIYGEPNSRSPSTKNGEPLELLYYAFDWAGPDVPQVMEVICTAPKDGSPGRVVEITLAASSL